MKYTSRYIMQLIKRNSCHLSRKDGMLIVTIFNDTASDLWCTTSGIALDGILQGNYVMEPV